MMLIKILFPAFFVFCSFPAWSLYFNWSGWTRFEAYYQQSKDKKDYYGGYHFVLNPDIHVKDGLILKGRLDLKLPSPDSSAASLPFYGQRGLILSSSGNSDFQQQNWGDLVLNPSQLYIDYEMEVLKVRVGRAPYHFGLGTVYSASENPFEHWMSVYNQASLYLEYSQFYLQPAFLNGDLNGEKTNRLLAQAGWLHKSWRLEGFYQHEFEKDSRIQLYGQYEKPNWQIKGSLGYIIKEKTNGAVAVEASTDFPKSFPFKLEVKAGGAVGEALFHPNYDVSLLFWNHLLTEAAPSDLKTATTEGAQSTAPDTEALDSHLKIAEGRIQKGLYFSPRILFSFFDENLKVRPILLFALDKKASHYELDLEAMYRLEENLFFSLMGGALYSDKKGYFGFLAQAAVSF